MYGNQSVADGVLDVSCRASIKSLENRSQRLLKNRLSCRSRWRELVIKREAAHSGWDGGEGSRHGDRRRYVVSRLFGGAEGSTGC